MRSPGKWVQLEKQSKARPWATLPLRKGRRETGCVRGPGSQVTKALKDNEVISCARSTTWSEVDISQGSLVECWVKPDLEQPQERTGGEELEKSMTGGPLIAVMGERAKETGGRMCWRLEMRGGSVKLLSRSVGE
ncbi:hypothetical protein Cadr_000030276 [Camelus dromedarius]|uniref:Uncharacterized protein n=1 Tax=Camelus dromedarius TaxID=9838 RepID=A0A5N4BYM5_CAMDR|nr:hypothetical protein Cadr_000030276 [Camelus dromedarius]